MRTQMSADSVVLRGCGLSRYMRLASESTAVVPPVPRRYREGVASRQSYGWKVSKSAEVSS